MNMGWFYSETITPDTRDHDMESSLFGRIIVMPLYDMGTDTRGAVWPDHAHVIKAGFYIVYEPGPYTGGRGVWSIYRAVADRYAQIACSACPHETWACIDAVQCFDDVAEIVEACDRITDDPIVWAD